MNIFKDIYAFICYLDGVDVIFLVAIIALLILLVTLFYFIKINKDEEDDNFTQPNNRIDKDSKEMEITLKEKIEENSKNSLNDIIDKIEIKVENEDDLYNDEEGELLDLASLTKKLQEQESNPDIISSTEYEKEQEEKAIISYDELVKKHNRYAINYEKEEVKDDLIIRKVNLNDLVNKNIVEEVKDVRVISYEKEEAFLSALKELNQLLN